MSQKFLKGAAILASAGLICRLIGVVIRIPLAHIVGNYGMGIYQMVFPLYALLLVASSAGVPVAISKMVAKEKVSGNMAECKKILVNSCILLGVIGFIISVLFMVLAVPISTMQGNRDIWIIYLAIAPSVLLVCIMSAFRGYFQGLENMIPTAISQIIEQSVKLMFALGLAAMLVKISIVWAVFGAILAVTISEVIALLYIMIHYAVSNKRNKSLRTGAIKKSVDIKLMWQILKQSVPITLMASIFPLILVADSMFIINLLTDGDTTRKEATQLFGISSGVVHTLINLPAVLGAALATAIVPCVSALVKQKKIPELRKKMLMSIGITVAISALCITVYMCFSREIINLLYKSSFKDNKSHLGVASRLLKIETALIFLIAISSVFTAMLQGVDRAKIPLIALGVGGAAKLLFQFSFIRTPLGIYSVAIGNVICFAIVATINIVFVLKFFKLWKLKKPAKT